jgi:HPt (histidine-containing phosphotransfer) domain-containing protein
MGQTVDLERIRTICMGDEEFMQELIGIYLDDAPTQLEILREAVAAADSKRTSSVAHRLKGASGNVGAERLSELCQKLEALGRNGEPAGFGAVFGELDTEFGRVRDRLTTVINGAE